MTKQPLRTSTAGHRQDCADQELHFQDARLNRVYRNAMNEFKSGGKDDLKRSSKLRDEQREWLSKTDETCAEAAKKAGSTMGPAALSTCLMDETAIRANWLEREHLGAGNSLTKQSN